MPKLFNSAILIWLLSFSYCNAQNFDDGLQAYKARNYRRALEIWLPLAENGDADAQYKIGLIYDLGKGLEEDDIEAAKWYRLAADQGHDWARAKLNAIEDEKLREDDARKAALLKEAEAQAAMEVQKRKQQVVVATYKACVILLSDDKVAALTNPLCHSLFLENGLPEGFQFE